MQPLNTWNMLFSLLTWKKQVQCSLSRNFPNLNQNSTASFQQCFIMFLQLFPSVCLSLFDWSLSENVENMTRIEVHGNWWTVVMCEKKIFCALSALSVTGDKLFWVPDIRAGLMFFLRFLWTERSLQTEAMKKFQVENILSKIYLFRCHDYMQLIALSHVLPDFLMEHSKVS